jgi:hypothetical protein
MQAKGAHRSAEGAEVGCHFHDMSYGWQAILRSHQFAAASFLNLQRIADC